MILTFNWLLFLECTDRFFLLLLIKAAKKYNQVEYRITVCLGVFLSSSDHLAAFSVFSSLSLSFKFFFIKICRDVRL